MEGQLGGRVEGEFIGGMKVRGQSIGKMMYMDIEITKNYESNSVRKVTHSE